MRFAILHIVHANHGMEDHAAGEAVQGEFGLDFGPSGEYGDWYWPVYPCQRAGARYPFFAQDEAAFTVAQEDGLKVVPGGFEGDLLAGGRDEVVGEFPIVVPAALVLVVLNLFASQVDAGEVLDGLGDGLAVAFGDVHQDTVHIENE